MITKLLIVKDEVQYLLKDGCQINRIIQNDTSLTKE